MSIIQEKVADFDLVLSVFEVDWTSTIFMMVYIPLVFPASWVLQKKGLRIAITLGAFLLCVGSWVKVFSTKHDQFAVGFAGQTIIGASQMFTLGAPARIAAVWFPHHQISTATAIGVFGNQVGIAIGFLLPPMVVKEESAGKDLHILFMIFQAAPPTAPSLAQKLVLANNNRKRTSFWLSLKRLFSNVDFDLLLVTFGINIGSLNTYSIHHFPSAVEHAGRLGVILIAGAIFGSFVWGIILDKTQLFKTTTICVNVSSTIVMVTLAYSPQVELMAYVYITTAFLGFFMFGFTIVGYEFGAELTYPEPEATPSGILNASGELCGVFFVISIGTILKYYGSLAACISLVTMIFFGLVLCLFIDGSKLRRSAANKQPIHSIPML